jgi:hypothetical protein
MRNRLAVLFATAVLIFAAPVAAEEYIPSHRSSITADVEEIQTMIQRSQERQGVVQTTQESKSAPELASDKVTNRLLVESPQIKVVPESTTVFEPSKPNTVFQPSTVFAPVNPATTPVPATGPSLTDTVPLHTEEPQTSQKIAVRHIGIQRQQREVADPEPSREDQISNRAFMLFASDLAWNRVDETSDKSIKNPYSLGARLEKGVITPLAALRIYAPHRVAEGLAILRGEKEYT